MVGIRSTFLEMMTELLQYRELLLQMTLRDIRLRYKQAVMGFAWAAFMPMLIVGAGLLVKVIMAEMSSTAVGTTSIAGLGIKALAWSFFIGSVGFATNSLISNTNLVTKVYFPREVFPLSSVLAQGFDSLIGSVVIIVFLFGILRVGLSVQLIWVLPLLILLVIFTSGLCLFLSCANLFFRDVKYIVQVLLTFGIFYTPVFYDAQHLGEKGSLLVMLNPLAPIFEGLRLAVVENHNLVHSLTFTSSAGQSFVIWQFYYLAYAALCSILSLLSAWLLFHQLESKFAEYI